MIKGLIVSILVLVTFDGISCSCFFSPEEKWQKEMINSADVIFIGTARLDASVQNIIYLGSDSLVQIEQLIFEVNESFKGLKWKREIKLYSHGCDGGYKVGNQYLIFGYNDGNPKLLRADMCGAYTENEHQGGMHIDSKHYRKLKELILREKKRLKF
jgi:hypothetical protein